jgi:thiamine-phosphate pyrophosphorylase
VSYFQIREKRLSASRLFELTRAVTEAAGPAGAKVLVNGRADIAIAAGAAGVHLPGDGVPAGPLRRYVPPGFVIAASTHTLAEAIAAKNSLVDLITFGPVYETPGKGPAAGLEALAGVCQACAPTPVLALGGIEGARVGRVLEHGAAGYASIRYLNDMLADQAAL